MSTLTIMITPAKRSCSLTDCPWYVQKDAVKLRELEVDLSHVWALRIELGFAEDMSAMLDTLLSDKGIAPRSERLEQG